MPGGITITPAPGSGGGGGGAPTDARYIVGAANGTLSAEVLLSNVLLAPDVAANRPAANLTGFPMIFVGTDTKRWYYSDGTAWTTVGPIIGTDVQAYSANLGALAGLTTSANKLAYWTGSGTAALTDLTAFALTLLDDTNQAGMQTTLGLVPGTNVQAYNAVLALLAGLTPAADRLPYFTGAGAASLATFTAAGRALVDDADTAAQRTTLGLGTMALEAKTLTTRGDLLYATTAGTLARLAVGTTGQALITDGTDPAWGWRGRVTAADATGATVNTTTSATTLLSASQSSPASLAVGDMVRIVAIGTALNNTGTNTYNFAFALKWGTASLFTWTTPNLTANASYRMWRLEADILITGIGAILGAGAAVVSADFAMTAASAGSSSGVTAADATTASSHVGYNAIATTITTNSSQTVDVTVAPSFSSANLSCRLLGFAVEHLPKATA